MSKANFWTNTEEYQEVIDCLTKYWTNESDEEYVMIDMLFKHKDGRQFEKTVVWSNPDMTFERQMALHYKQKVENSGLKLGYIAEQMGVSRQTLWAKLGGKSRLTVEDELKLDAILLKGGNDDTNTR